jgi:hypothetical protein
MRTFLFLAYCFVAIIVHGQKPATTLDKSITIHSVNETISSVLEKMGKQAGVSFSYNPTAINADKKVLIHCLNKPLRIVLNQLLNNSIKYKQKGNVIILTPKPTTQHKAIIEQVEIIGYIYDDAGERLPQVSVYSKTHHVACVSNQYGYYTLKIPSNAFPVKLSIAKNEYNDTAITITSAIEDQNIVLYAAPKKPLATINISIPLATDTVAYIPIDTAKVDTPSIIHKKKFFENFVLSPNIKTNLKNITDTFFSKTQIGLVPYVSTNSLLSGNTINDYSFNLLVGYSQGVNKMELGGLANIDRGNVNYIQAAGLFNAVGGDMNGIQLAGWGNITKGKSDGVVAAGIFNAGTHMHGIQMAGITNINISYPQKLQYITLKEICTDTVDGIQAAGISNINLGHTEGINAAGIINIAHTIDGVQAAGITNINWGVTNGWSIAGMANLHCDTLNGNAIAGMANISLKNTNGIQIAGLFNYAQYTVNGMQLSSILNTAKVVNGIQLGLINISDSINGLPIGLFSFVRKGYNKLEVFGDDIMYTQLAWRMGMPHFHNIFTAGIDLTSRYDGLWSLGYGIGSTFLLSPKWQLSTDLIAQQLIQGTFENTPLVGNLWIGAERKLTNRFTISIGPSIHTLIGFGAQQPYGQVVQTIAPYTLFEREYNNGNSLQAWVGAKISLKFL